MSHAVLWLNCSVELAHIRATLDTEQYGERRANEQRKLRVGYMALIDLHWFVGSLLTGTYIRARLFSQLLGRNPCSGRDD